jgi:hypothetical protein
MWQVLLVEEQSLCLKKWPCHMTHPCTSQATRPRPYLRKPTCKMGLLPTQQLCKPTTQNHHQPILPIPPQLCPPRPTRTLARKVRSKKDPGREKIWNVKIQYSFKLINCFFVLVTLKLLK